jgi:hypothetical protein
MYEPQASKEELAAWGLTEDDLAAVEVLPDVETAYELFGFMRTQWYTGMAGPTGLRYGIAFHKMDRMCLCAEEYEQLELDMRVMEGEALTVMREQMKRNN